MPKFKVTDKMACWVTLVTWSYEIEAATQEEAIEKYLDGDHGDAEPVIGHSLDWVGDEMDVELIEEPK